MEGFKRRKLPCAVRYLPLRLRVLVQQWGMFFKTQDPLQRQPQPLLLLPILGVGGTGYI